MGMPARVLSFCRFSDAKSFADAIVKGPGGQYSFVEPCVEKMTMQELLNSLNQGDLGFFSMFLEI